MRTMVETLETRQLLSTNWVLTPEGILSIAGTRNNDTIVVYRIKDSMALRFNGRVVAAFPLTDLNEIHIFGNGGNDDLRVNGPIRAILVGGEGNDFLQGGNGDDVLVGGGGNDRLNGRGGNDILRGDNGNDTLNGGPGDDILYGGIDVLDRQGRPARNTLNGGPGNNVAITSGSANDRLINISRTEAEDWRPAGVEFPEAISFLLPQVSVAVAGRDALLSVAYTLPNDGVRALFSHLVRPHRRGDLHLGSVVLSDSVGRSPSPLVLGTSREIEALNPGDFTALLDAPEGPVFRTPFSIQRV